MEYMIGTIDQYVDDPRRQRSNRNKNFIRKQVALICFMFGKFLGNYLVVLYLFVKLLYIANCVGQLFLISILLGRNYYIYGASIFFDFIQGKGYADSEYFPRVTMCKFHVRELGLKNYSHEYNVQCVLPINLFNQQIFTFLWFWYLLLLTVNVSTLFIWIYRFVPRNQYNYTIRRIKLLRIRLIENAKKNDSNSNINLSSASLRKKKLKWQDNDDYSADFVDTSTDNHPFNPKYMIATILNEKYDNDSSFKYDKSDFEKIESIPISRESLLFPNMPANFHSSLKQRRSTTLHNQGSVTTLDSENRSFRIPVVKDYKTYMSEDSFCSKNYKEFVYDYLQADGMFMLRMIQSNSGDFVCTQVLHNLWKLYLCKKHNYNTNSTNNNETSFSFNHKKNSSNIQDSIFKNKIVNDQNFKLFATLKKENNSSFWKRILKRKRAAIKRKEQENQQRNFNSKTSPQQQQQQQPENNNNNNIHKTKQVPSNQVSSPAFSSSSSSTHNQRTPSLSLIRQQQLMKKSTSSARTSSTT
jgi:hypothetical protein